ncbi:MAG: hypothetical protein RL119_721, partial [Actinomycetota bacterium]
KRPPRRAAVHVERVTGIEPAFSAWEADVLPLNYTRRDPQITGQTGPDHLRDRPADQLR